jgi:hypothetical protein
VQRRQPKTLPPLRHSLLNWHQNLPKRTLPQNKMKQLNFSTKLVDAATAEETQAALEAGADEWNSGIASYRGKF